jgi:hypothetical protein
VFERILNNRNKRNELKMLLFLTGFPKFHLLVTHHSEHGDSHGGQTNDHHHSKEQVKTYFF